MENTNNEKQCAIHDVSTRYCPDCKTEVKHLGGMNTDWYGRLDYYKCKCCKEKFVSRDGDELEIAAP